MNRSGRWGIVGVFLMAIAWPSLAASQAVRAGILGTVHDETGATLPGVTIEARNISTGIVQTAVTDGEGRFAIADLPIGIYDVQASLSGFRALVRQGVQLRVGSQGVLDFVLGVGNLEETITVAGGAPLVDTVSAGVGTTIDQRQLSDLPLNGRSFVQLLLLAPGVTTSSTSANTGTATANGMFFGRQPNYSISGSRPEGQALLLDNTNIQGFWNRGAGSGVLGTTLGVEAVAEMQVLTNTYSAQFGGSGSAINAITKSGTNSVTGSTYWYLRNDRFDARNFFDGQSKPEFSKNQFGMSLGGPIRPNNAFFFFNYEGVKERRGETKIVTVPDMNARNGLLPVNGVLTPVPVSPVIRPVLDLYPVPTRLLGGGVGQLDMVGVSPGSEHYILGRVDYVASAKTSFFVRYVSDRAEFTDAFAGGGTLMPNWPALAVARNSYTTTEMRQLVSSNVTNRVRFSYTNTLERADSPAVSGASALQFFPGRTLGRVEAGSGITPIGQSTNFPMLWSQRRVTVADDLFWIKGSHSLKVGAEFVSQVSRGRTNANWGGTWTFTSLSAFLQNQANVFVSALPGQDESLREVSETMLSTYAQDDWQIGRRITLNLGVRYSPHLTIPSVTDGLLLIDPPRSPAFTPVDRSFDRNPTLRDVEPRLGVVFDPFEDHKTSVRAGYAVYHNAVAANRIVTAFVVSPPYTVVRQTFPTFPLPYAGTVAANKISTSQQIDYMVGDSPYMRQWNINVQREVARATSVTVGYVASRGVNLNRQRDVNPSTPRTLADGTTVYGLPRGPGLNGIVENPRVNPDFGLLQIARMDGKSDYESLQVTLDRRFQAGVQVQGAYTWSRCRDQSSGASGGEAGTVQTNPYDPDYDYGPCVFDVPHSFRASAVMALPFGGNRWLDGWTITGIVTALSGSPFTPVIGFDQAGTASPSQRPSLAPDRRIDDVVRGGITQYFDPTAFVLPAPGTFGTVGRNSLRGPGYVSIDLGLLKNIRAVQVSGRQINVQLRVEVFNALNHANFGTPNSIVFVQTANGGGAPNSTAGRITSANSPRQIQFAARMTF